MLTTLLAVSWLGCGGELTEGELDRVALATSEVSRTRATQCLVYVHSCPRRTEFTGQRIADRYKGADQSLSKCMARASSWKNWCGSRDVVVADFYRYGEHIRQSKAGMVRLTRVRPIVVTRSGTVIRNKEIHTVGQVGIIVRNANNVLIENVRIYHRGQAGIRVENSKNVLIRSADIINSSLKGNGSAVNELSYGIYADRTHRLRIDNVRTIRGHTGIQVRRSHRPILTRIQSHDTRGFVVRSGSKQSIRRGHCVQFLQTTRPELLEFSCSNLRGKSIASDLVSIYQSDDAVIRNGSVDFSPHPSGAGVIFEYSKNGTVSDVDARRLTGAAFVASGSSGIRFIRTRAKEIYCMSSGFGPSSANGIVYYAAFRDPRYNNDKGRTRAIEIIDSTYGPKHHSCGRHLPTIYSDQFKRLELSARDYAFENRFKAMFPFD